MRGVSSASKLFKTICCSTTATLHSCIPEDHLAADFKITAIRAAHLIR